MAREERKLFRNQYKRLDIFRCGFASHRRFQRQVSVYHVLVEKQCFPHGCVYFHWECALRVKGRPCPRKYRQPGRKCFGCKEFDAEKRCFAPQLAIGQEEYKKFFGELKEFESWIADLEGQEISFSGVVKGVKPHLVLEKDGARVRWSFPGFLVIFSGGFFQYDAYEDICYLRVGRRRQERLQFRAGDQVEMRATVSLDRGRIVLKRDRAVEFDARGETRVIPWEEWLTAVETGSLLSSQPERCLECERGCLTDVTDNSRGEQKRYRRIVCLEGMDDPSLCGYTALKKLNASGCPRRMGSLSADFSG